MIKRRTTTVRTRTRKTTAITTNNGNNDNNGNNGNNGNNDNNDNNGINGNNGNNEDKENNGNNGNNDKTAENMSYKIGEQVSVEEDENSVNSLFIRIIPIHLMQLPVFDSFCRYRAM